MSDVEPPVMKRLRERAARRIREAREAKELSQAQLAELAGTTQQTIDRIERGVTHKSKSMAAILQALDLDLQMEDLPTIQTTVTIEPVETPMLGPHTILQAVRSFTTKTPGKLPIFRITNYGFALVNVIAPPYPVEMVPDAYGLVWADHSMDPVVRHGDIVIVNPHLPAQAGNEVVSIWHAEGRDFVSVFSLMSDDADYWHFQTHSPRETINRPKEGSTTHMIVAKVSRFR